MVPSQIRREKKLSFQEQKKNRKRKKKQYLGMKDYYIQRIQEIQEQAIASKRAGGWKHAKTICYDMLSVTILRYTKLVLNILISRRHQHRECKLGFFF